MSAVLQRPGMTREEFLAWDETQDEQSEYDGVGPFAMVGGTVSHAAITRNLLGLLWQALRSKACQPHGGDLRVKASGRIRRPDALISCTRAKFGDLTARDPVVVFDVLSPSIAMTDTATKNLEYRAIPSILRYVMVQQDRIFALVFIREAGSWIGSVHDGEAASLDMPEIGVSLRLGDLYEGVMTFPPLPS